jgi:hypothetical protein
MDERMADDDRPHRDAPSNGVQDRPLPDAGLDVGDSPAEPAAIDDSIIALFTRLVDDAERFVRAELRLYRANLFSRLRETRSAIIMLLTGFLLAQSAIIALLVGLVIILRPMLGAIGATALVVGASITIAAMLAWFGIDKIGRATDIKDKAP